MAEENTRGIDSDAVDHTLKHCVDNDGKTFVVFWLYNADKKYTAHAMMTKLEPNWPDFVEAAQIAEGILVPHITPESGVTWDVRFTIMDPAEAAEYADRAGITEAKETVWEDKPDVTKH